MLGRRFTCRASVKVSGIGQLIASEVLWAMKRRPLRGEFGKKTATHTFMASKNAPTPIIAMTRFML